MNDTHQPIHALPPGYRLQEYELVRVLGFGGFGMTYLGFDHNLDKAVAIKEYLPSDIATRSGGHSVIPQASQFQEDFEWGLARFLDEARALARFDHRHIIKVYRFFEAHGTAYIVMEYAEGETLSEFLNRKGVLNEAELQAILYPLLAGLDVVHGADFLHRDIKPGNIIIRDEDASPVLLDFGAARQAAGSRSRSVTSILTPGYAPIEQYSSRGAQGAWTDIYALGGVCYRALTGDVPDDATDRVRNDPLVPLVERCAGRASVGFLSAIDMALSVDEGDRPQSIGEWRVALGQEVPRDENVQPSVPTLAPQAGEARQAEAFVAKVGRGPSPVGANNKGETDLHVVAALNLAMIARSLLDQGADVHAKNNYGDTPLHVAASNNAGETAEVLLDRGADVQAKANDGSTPLHVAASNNAGATAEILLKYGADVRAKNKYGGTPLDVAAATDARETTEVLLDQGKEVRTKAKDSRPPLPDEEQRKEKSIAKPLAAVVCVVVILIAGISYLNQVEEQRQELAAERARLAAEQAALEKQRREEAAERARRSAEEAEKARQEQAALEKARQEQVEQARREEEARLATEQAERVLREQAALEKQRREEEAERARLAAEEAERARREQVEKQPIPKTPMLSGGGRRGFLGVQVLDLDPSRARVLGLRQGVVIKRVIPGKAADRAGVQANDVVIGVDGYSVRDANEFVSRIGRVRPGTPVELSILRNGRRMRIRVVLDASPEGGSTANRPLSSRNNIQPGRRFKDCSACPEMIVVPSGSFAMGSPLAEVGRKDTESPQRRVRFNRPFAVGVYEVTFEEWDACVNAGGCNNSYPLDQGWGRGKRPVINVSWNDAQAYVQWLSGRTGKNYRLLSESEWEYVARAGTTTPFSVGATISTDQANYNGNSTYRNGSKGLFRKKTLPVGTLPPNPFGLYDMHGNVIEWTQDCWNDSYQRVSSGVAREYGNCGFRVIRGGSWYNEPRYLRSANRGRATIKIRNSYIGFRVARTF